MFYNLKTDSNTKDMLFIPKEIYDKFTFLNNKSNIIVSAGAIECNVVLSLAPDLQKDCIVLSENISNLLSIPLDISYQIIVTENKISLGPIIGLLFAKHDSKLNEQELNNALVYTLLYSEFRGLLFIFSSESINFTTKTVEGFYFKPDLYEGKVTWIKRTLPIPDVVYRRVGLPSKFKKDLKKLTHNNVFNSYYFDKWEFYNMISKYNNTLEYIPYTKLLKSVSDIEDTFKKFNTLYLKPSDGSLASGLIRIEKHTHSYHIKRKHDDSTTIIDTQEDFLKFTNEISSRKYLIQQAVDSIKIDERYIDFRVIMQKNENLSWQCTGIISCVGKKNGICSNYQSHGYTLNFKDMMKKLGFEKEKFIFKKQEEIIRACTDICKILDLSEENYGDLGIDIMLDNDLKIWIIEINKRHDHSMPLSIKDNQMYFQVKSNPIKYAVGLSNFSFYV